MMAGSLFAVMIACKAHGDAGTACDVQHDTLQLALPRGNKTTLEGALRQRRSALNFSTQPLSLEEISQILWAAQGVTDPPSGKRTAPSSGATYPITMYLSAHNIDSLEPGLYRYRSECHQLQLVAAGDYRRRIHAIALRQQWALEASAVIIFSGNSDKVARKYKNHSRDSVLLEAGHISQNIYLQCTALDMGVVAIGGFSRTEMHALLGLPEEEEVVYLNLIGHHRR